MTEYSGFSGAPSTTGLQAPSINTGPQMSGGQSFEGGVDAGFSSREVFKNISFESQPTSIVDISHGKDSFSMFDKNNPVIEDPIVPHESQPNFETIDSSIIDIHHGKSEQSFFKDPAEFGKDKPIFDISNPIIEDPVESFDEDENQEVVLDQPGVKVLDAQKEVTISPFENTIILWQAPKQESKVQPSHDKVEPSAEVDPVVDAIEITENGEETGFQPEVQTEIGTYVSVPTRSEFGTFQELDDEDDEDDREFEDQEKETVKSLQKGEARVTIADLVEARLTAAVTTNEEVQQNIKVAETELTTQLATQEKISLKKAREALAKVIVEDQVAEVQPTIEVSTQANTEVLPTQKTKLSKKAQLKPRTMEEKARALYEKRQEEKVEQTDEAPPVEPDEDPEVLVIKRDDDVNWAREKMMTREAEKELQKNGSTTGKELADNLEGVMHGKKSEIVEGIQEDWSSRYVLQELRRAGTIKDKWQAQKIAHAIVSRITGVLLAYDKRSHQNASVSDAEKVYNNPFDRVEANVKDDRSVGEVFETQGNNHIYAVKNEPRILPIEKELLSSAA